jgi:hypothetical protein
MTDSEIRSSSDHEEHKGRSLQKVDSAWLPNNANPFETPLTSSEEKLTPFDQFKVNEEKFNITATYDESNYTTVLDRSKVTDEQERKATEIAEGIESTSSTNSHIQEERGQTVPDDGMNEEEKFSAVLPSDHGADSTAKPAMLSVDDDERQYLAPAVKALFASAESQEADCEYPPHEEHPTQLDKGNDIETTVLDQGTAGCSLRHDMEDTSAVKCNCITEGASGMASPNDKHTFTEAERSCFRRSEIQNHEYLFDDNVRCFVSYHPDVSKIEYEKKQEQPRRVEQTKQEPGQVATKKPSKDSSCAPTSPQIRACAGSTLQQCGESKLGVEKPTNVITRQVILIYLRPPLSLSFTLPFSLSLFYFSASVQTLFKFVNFISTL